MLSGNLQMHEKKAGGVMGQLVKIEDFCENFPFLTVKFKIP